MTYRAFQPKTMPTTPGLNSRSRRFLTIPTLILLGCFAVAPHSHGQATPATRPASPSDPTRPEAQPPLDLDRDPVASPDPDEITAADLATHSSGSATGEIQKGQSGMYLLHEDVDEVLLNCTVIDEHGRTVAGLNRDDFHVWEDGVPQTISALQNQDLPVSMGILVDNSGSMRDKRAAVRSAAYDLLRASNPQNSYFVVNFSERAYLDQGFTSDVVALDRSLSRFDSQGTTALYDAVAASADELAQHARERKQVLLIITDGADNASQLDLQQAIRRVQDLGGPVVYSIGLLFDADREEQDRAREALQRLSQETGGIAYFPRSLNDVDSVAQDVARDIRNQYVVAYHSSKPSRLGGYRTVRVEAIASGHGRMVVRTRRGYYAKPAQHSQTAQRVIP